MKRKLYSLLILLLCVFLLVACTEEQKPGEDKQKETDPNQTDDAGGHPTIKKQDNEGRSITFYTRGPAHGHGYTIDIYAEEEKGERINDAVYKRNRKVEDYLGVEIKQIQADAAMGELIYRDVSSGTAEYDVAILYAKESAYLAENNCLLDLNSIESLQLGQPWWDQNANEGYTIGEKLYFTCGDITVWNHDGTWFMTFNKKILEDNQLESPYQLVRNNEWTWDKYYEMAKEGSRELTGDGKRDENDQYGISTEHYDTYAMFLASGEKIVTMDENHMPELSIYTSRSTSVMDKIFEIVKDTDTYTTKIGVLNFGKGTALFCPTTILTMRLSFHEMKNDFGVLPIPKFDANQDRYYHVVSVKGTVNIPKTVKDPEFIGTVLEYMTYESSKILIPEYYNVILENRYLRDEESREMLDIIFSTRIFDLAGIYDWGKFYTYLYSITANSGNDFASNYAKNYEIAQSDIQETVELYTALD